jgi:hypothetical protein
MIDEYLSAILSTSNPTQICVLISFILHDACLVSLSSAVQSGRRDSQLDILGNTGPYK